MNFVLGTDQHGFLLGDHPRQRLDAASPHVTVNEVAFDAWNQLVVVKDSRGFQKFYLNGTNTVAGTFYARKSAQTPSPPSPGVFVGIPRSAL